MNKLKSPDKPFEISKWAVQEAWEKVKANKGAPGVDGANDLEAFEADLQNNLYQDLESDVVGQVTFRLRCGRWRYRSRMARVENARCAYYTLTGWRKRWSAEQLKSRVEAIFHAKTLMVTGPGARRWMRSPTVHGRRC